MPIYEYQCQACAHQFEHWQKMSDPLLTECPSCQQGALRKLISAGGFQLKGDGWYVTDFKDRGKPKAEPKAESKPDAAKPASSAADKAKSTPEAAAE